MGLSNSSKMYIEAFSNGPKLQDLPPQQVRDALAMASTQPFDVEVPPVGNVENRTIPVENGEIPIRIYTPSGEGPFPLFVYYHGGGWVIGDLDTYDAGCRLLAEQLKRVVVSVEYRLAPEFKFPVPVEDCYTALLWVNENASSINADASDIVVGGDSAGGNLATVMAILSHENNGPTISAQVLIYPATHLNFTTNSYDKFAEGYGLSRELMIWFGEHYVNDSKEYEDYRVSPLLYENVSALPPAVVIAAEYDVLLDEGAKYEEKLRNAGVHTAYTLMEGSVHGYFSNMILFAEETKQTVNTIAEFLNTVKNMSTV